MAYLRNRIVAPKGGLTVVDTTAQAELGTRMFDNNGYEYIYLQGVASTVAGSVVTYDNAYATTLLVADTIGPIAVAQAATVASTYGWYMIFGSATAKSGTVVSGANVYGTSTGGQVDDAVVAGDRIKNAKFKSADSGGFATVHIWYPFVDDGAAA